MTSFIHDSGWADGEPLDFKAARTGSAAPRSGAERLNPCPQRAGDKRRKTLGPGILRAIRLWTAVALSFTVGYINDFSRRPSAPPPDPLSSPVRSEARSRALSWAINPKNVDASVARSGEYCAASIALKRPETNAYQDVGRLLSIKIRSRDVPKCPSGPFARFVYGVDRRNHCGRPVRPRGSESDRAGLSDQVLGYEGPDHQERRDRPHGRERRVCSAETPCRPDARASRSARTIRVLHPCPPRRDRQPREGRTRLPRTRAGPR